MDATPLLNIIEIITGTTGLLLLLAFGRDHCLRFSLAFSFSWFVVEPILSIACIHSPEEELVRLSFLIVFILVFSTELSRIKRYNKFLTSNILDSLPDLVWVKDHEGRYTYVNSAILEAIFKCKKEFVLGKTDRELFSECTESGNADRNLCEMAVESDRMVKKTGKAVKVLEIGTIGGRTIAVQVIKSPLYNRYGEFMGIVAIGRDLLYDIQDHAQLEKLYRSGNFEEFEKLFEEHKFKYIQKPTSCS